MKHFFLIVLAIALITPASAQYNTEVGFKLGGSNYLGEMGGKEDTRRDFLLDMKLSQTRWSAAGFVRYRINPQFSLNAGLGYVRIQGADSLSLNRGRVSRNLHFRNDIFDLYVRGEFVFFSENDVGNRGRYRMDFRAFVFGGIAGFYHNPKTSLNGDWIKLRPLNTEGPGKTYGPISFAIPLGFGFHFTYKRRHRFGLESTWNWTFTDYIDDVSTTYANPANLNSDQSVILANRNPELGDIEAGSYDSDSYAHPDNYLPGEKRGDPTHDDTYMTVQLTYSYVLRGRSNFYRQKYGFMLGKKKRGRKSRAKF